MGAKESHIDVVATKDSFDEVMGFLEGELEAAGCPPAMMTRIAVAVEEIFVNVASYAYDGEAREKGTDTCTVSCSIDDDTHEVDITFIDHGTPFNPLAKADPDITASAEERSIGGLGIFMVKKIMDDVRYDFKDGENVLSIRKGWAEQ